MAIDNGSFETPGTSAWLADGWTSTFVYSGWLIADFGVDSPLSVETFGPGWSNPEYVATIVGINAPFDSVWVSRYLQTPNGVESFAYWRRFTRRTSVFGPSALFYYVSTNEYLNEERFTSGWSNDDYMTTINGQDFWESFLSWMPDPYITDTIGGTEAEFGGNGGPFTVETFGSIKPDVPFTVDVDTNKLFVPNHPFVSTENVFVLTTGIRPGGLGENVQYYVVYHDPNHIYLSKIPDGDPVNITDFGTGIHTLRADQSIWWTTTID